MRAKFVLPKAKEMELSAEFSQFMIRTIDKVSNYKINQKLKVKLVKLRTEFESKRVANQEKQKETEERLRREKEEKWANMTPKERKKAMEVEAKRMKKRGVRKMKMK
jgi:hypothetical protein